MSNKFVHTCYGCPHYYADKGFKWPTKHCGILDHWNDCENWKSVKEVEKEELIQAIHLMKMCKEYGPEIDKRWTTATQQTAYLDDAYRRGFQDGVNKEHDRIISILERKENSDD